MFNHQTSSSHPYNSCTNSFTHPSLMETSSTVQQLTPEGVNLGHSPVVVKPSSVDRSRGYEEGEPIAHLKRRNKFIKMDNEMHWNFISVKDWMSTCLPGTDPTDSVFQPFNVVLNKNEAAMYPGVVSNISVCYGHPSLMCCTNSATASMTSYSKSVVLNSSPTVRPISLITLWLSRTRLT